MTIAIKVVPLYISVRTQPFLPDILLAIGFLSNKYINGSKDNELKH